MPGAPDHPGARSSSPRRGVRNRLSTHSIDIIANTRFQLSVGEFNPTTTAVWVDLQAVTATAHKIARISFTTRPYDETVVTTRTTASFTPVGTHDSVPRESSSRNSGFPRQPHEYRCIQFSDKAVRTKPQALGAGVLASLYSASVAGRIATGLHAGQRVTPTLDSEVSATRGFQTSRVAVAINLLPRSSSLTSKGPLILPMQKHLTSARECSYGECL